jgi:hypothetical protein
MHRINQEPGSNDIKAGGEFGHSNAWIANIEKESTDISSADIRQIGSLCGLRGGCVGFASWPNRVVLLSSILAQGHREGRSKIPLMRRMPYTGQHFVKESWRSRGIVQIS